METGAPKSRQEAEKTEEEIVEQIINRAESHTNFDKDGEVIYVNFILKYGSKTLRLKWDIEYQTYKTSMDFYIEKTQSNENKLPAETTLLQKAVKKILQNLADQTNKPLLYTMITKNEKLINWAKNQGQAIFEWDKTDDANADDDYTFAAWKTFKPKND